MYNEEDISNIAGIGGMTRSGRVYAAKDPQEKTPKEKGKEAEEGKESESKGGTDELLQFIRQSEYSIVSQLNQTPAKITLLSLILSSEIHRNALLKILNEAYVPPSISQDKFEGIVGNITANDYLTFTDEEIPSDGPKHNRPLHISVKCREYHIARVLIDNGSSLNVMPKRTLDQLTLQEAHIRPSNTIVRAFDGSKREVVGEVTLPIQIGPVTFQIDFQVMDINPAYSCLLGRPWIHDAKAVPSTLHQKVKFVTGDKLVVVHAEDDLIVSKPPTLPYVDTAEEALETSFQALEIANVERIPSNLTLVARMMTRNGYYSGQGLGRNLQGITELPIIKDNPRRQGLGYDPHQAHGSRESLNLTLYQRFRKGGVQGSKSPLVLRFSVSE